jgi:phosphatidylglycerol---prolipoprotein diacylglyceryl transferase
MLALWLGWLLWRTPTGSVHGRLFGAFLTSMFVVRILVEYTKAPQSEWLAEGWLNMGQALSLPYLVVGLYLWLRKAPNSGFLKG